MCGKAEHPIRPRCLADDLPSYLSTSVDVYADYITSQLRHLLGIPITQDILLERFSDSAGAYITLDSTNPSIYKQLYRAAKAKLKLRIKLTVIDTPAPQAHVDHPELSPSDRLTSNCYVPPMNPDSAKAEATGPLSIAAGSIPQPASFDISATSSTLAQAKIDSSRQLLKSSIQPELLSKFHQCPALMTSAAPPSVNSTVMKDAKNSNVKTDDEALPSRFFSAREHFNAELAGMTRDRYTPLRSSDQAFYVPGSGFTICCNKCDAAIPNAHWHCSRCDNGDFDLCADCVNKGVSCESKDHWLIKRFVQNGKVTTSTTERIEPKKLSTVENVTAKEAMEVNTNGSDISELDQSGSRTCNSCIDGRTRNLLYI
jgi:next to BRCA1 gene 1 protein